MLFAIDVGNTHTLLGLFAGGELLAHWRLTTDRVRTVDEYGILTSSLLARRGIELSELDGIVISCVVPPLVGVLEAVSRDYFQLEPLMVTARLVPELSILYRPPEDVGSDRIVNAVAAIDRFGPPAIVVDFGTATTFDVIDGDGAYVGGIIVPGIGISSDALFSRAARLPRVDIVQPDRVVGRSTVESMQSGLFYGYVDLVDGLLNRVMKEIEGRPHTVATGGWAAALGPECAAIDAVDPLLTLTGLRLIHERHGGRSDR